MVDNPADEQVLSGCRVLVVEDEYFLADDIAEALQTLGAYVVGPAANAEQALRLLAEEGRIDLAVLDINLRNEMVYPVAQKLRQRGVPFVFTTGYDKAALSQGYQDVPRWDKPYDPMALARSLPSFFRRD